MKPHWCQPSFSFHSLYKSTHFPTEINSTNYYISTGREGRYYPELHFYHIVNCSIKDSSVSDSVTHISLCLISERYSEYQGLKILLCCSLKAFPLFLFSLLILWPGAKSLPSAYLLSGPVL